LDEAEDTLGKLLFQFYMLARSYNSNDNAFNDAIVRGMRKATETKEVSISLTLACQVLVDTHRVLGTAVTDGLQNLRDMGSRSTSALSKHFNFLRSMDNQTWVRVNTPSEKPLLDTATLIARWVRADGMAKLVEELYGPGHKFKVEPFELMRNHPTMCGYLRFATDSRLHFIGLHYCSDIGNVITMAHLYHAARQSGYLTTPWADMDMLVAIHGEEHLFVGKAPADPKLFADRLALAAGLSPQLFARNMRPLKSDKLPQSTKGKRRFIS